VVGTTSRRSIPGGIKHPKDVQGDHHRGELPFVKKTGRAGFIYFFFLYKKKCRPDSITILYV